MQAAIGYVLIVIGVIGGISVPFKFMNEKFNDPSEFIGQAAGAGIFVFGMIFVGFLLVRSAAQDQREEQRPPRRRRD